MIKKITVILLATFILPVHAQQMPRDFVFQNDTTKNMSFGVHHCVKELGTVYASNAKIITSNDLKIACPNSPNQCLLKIYSDPNCSGNLLAAIQFNNLNGEANVIFAFGKKLSYTWTPFHFMITEAIS